MKKLEGIPDAFSLRKHERIELIKKLILIEKQVAKVHFANNAFLRIEIF